LVPTIVAKLPASVVREAPDYRTLRKELLGIEWDEMPNIVAPEELEGTPIPTRLEAAPEAAPSTSTPETTAPSAPAATPAQKPVQTPSQGANS
jgi:hypothetical protein